MFPSQNVWQDVHQNVCKMFTGGLWISDVHWRVDQQVSKKMIPSQVFVKMLIKMFIRCSPKCLARCWSKCLSRCSLTCCECRCSLTGWRTSWWEGGGRELGRTLFLSGQPQHFRFCIWYFWMVYFRILYLLTHFCRVYFLSGQPQHFRFCILRRCIWYFFEYWICWRAD